MIRVGDVALYSHIQLVNMRKFKDVLNKTHATCINDSNLILDDESNRSMTAAVLITCY